jgi:heme/copper-type cytochrome/quinol oxidase subunit 2
MNIMKKELFARFLVIFFILTTVSIPIVGRWLTSNKWENTIELQASVFEYGSWSMDHINVTTGEPIHLRITSHDVVHGFAIGGYALTPLEVLPGKYVEATLTFDEPGEYTFFCTRWCGPNHTKMRGTIEVTSKGK